MASRLRYHEAGAPTDPRPLRETSPGGDAGMGATDVYPGKDLGTLELTITDEMVQHYVKGLDEPNPWYLTTSPFAGPVAPVIVYQDADTQFKGWYLDNLF